MRGNPFIQLRKRPFKFTVSLLWLALVLSTLGGESLAVSQGPASKREQPRPASGDDDVEQLRKAVQQLTAVVEGLKKEVAKLDHYRQVDYLRDLLVKEEQRAEGLQTQLADLGDKELPLQTRLEQIDAQLQPGKLEEGMAGTGSLRPEEDRDSLQRRLGNEKRRLTAQIDLLHQSRPRLQAALATADASIAQLRARLTDATTK